MEAIINQIKGFAVNADETTRTQIRVALREVSDSLETPLDTVQRLVYGALPLTAIRIGLDLDIFKTLIDSKSPVTISDFATKTGAAPIFLGRILRYLASIGLIKEAGKDTFTHNHITENIMFPGASGAYYNYFYTTYPVWSILPDWLKEHKYQDVEDNHNTALQKAHKTDLTFFSWMLTQPTTLAHFNEYMSIRHTGKRQWHEVYPLDDQIKALAPEQVFFVDVGGGKGQQSRALRTRYPDLKAKIIMQDTPGTSAQAIPFEGIEIMAQDIFDPQAVKGARIYYMRNILHDFPDDKCVTIMKNLVDVMAPGSVLLLDEMIVPNTGAHFHATQQDIIVMATFAALERTEEHWHKLVERAGLKINKIYPYSVSEADGLMECVKV